MPDILTGSSDLRRPNRRPTREVAAEVTKKIIGLNDQAIAPPAFSLPKIGGAVDFLQQEELDEEKFESSREGKGDFKKIGGISGARFVSSESSAQESEQEHPLAAPPGWRRFWGDLRWENLNIPDIILSPFCKHCYDEGLARSCSRDRQGIRCKIYHDGPCLFVISNQPHPAEDISVDDIPEYRMRQLVRERLDTIGSPLEIPTSKTEGSRLIRLPSLPKPETTQTSAARPEPTAPEPRPTYSQFEVLMKI